jgi:hypothetical protein
MNVFEDLIGELKNENLLEDTVIQVRNAASHHAPNRQGQPEHGSLGDFAFAEEETVDFQPADLETEEDALVSDDLQTHGEDSEFFRKRAMEEVSSLQMVEHVLAGVEREYMKITPVACDDLEIKKALHRFLQVSRDANSDARTDAEYKLLQETQEWHSALFARDKNISVANIRLFCENSRPVLSAQALMALARFYRNSPFTEEVRGKFDFVMTRLFSRDDGYEQRKLLFGRLEMIGHIKTLYNNWSSISYHAAEDHQADIDLAVSRFNDLARNSDAAETVDELLKADVFQVIRGYKEECGELFYVPDVAAAAIDCNVQLGNKYVKLILKERSKHGAAAIEEKYGFKYDQAVSNACGKTLLLANLLGMGTEENRKDEHNAVAFEQESFILPSSTPVASYDIRRKKGLFGVSRWLVAATILVAIGSGGVYLWAGKFAGTETPITVASELNLDGTGLKAHLKTVRVSNETAYCLTEPSWDTLGEPEQKEFLGKVYAFAQTKGLKRVNLLNQKGRTIAFVTKDKVELFKPS